jgi:hypothetical protein
LNNTHQAPPRKRHLEHALFKPLISCAIRAAARRRVLKHPKPSEVCLRNPPRDLSSLKRSVILCDVTNTHVEGACVNPSKANCGNDKQKRNDCSHVAMGMPQ